MRSNGIFANSESVGHSQAELEVINIASVPQRSPFRYPGGKTWLVPYIRRWLSGIPGTENLIEPFAGGGIVSLTAVCEELAKQATLIEKDPHVAAVWHTLFNGDAEWLANRIGDFEISLENVNRILSAHNQSVRDRAFATIIRNRVQRGGILAPGAGLIKNGENGRGLQSRWYPGTLRRRILAIHEIRERLSFIEGDGLPIIKQYANQSAIAFFVDPPYTVAGKRLYQHSEIDHKSLFDLMSQVSGNFLMTYDHSPEICALTSRFNLQAKLVPMKSSHHKCKHELLIGRDLSWLAGSLV